MVDVSPELISIAANALGVEDVSVIGAPGGQKTVRHVRRPGEDLVLKVIGLTASAPDVLRRAAREVELLAELHCDNVVGVASPLIELGDPVVGAAWLEEFLDGADLASLLGPQWNWGDAADMAMQVSRGLAAGHERHVVHRDLSANNVRRTSAGVYKVLDFGFARHTLRSGLTVAGQPGTPGFMTPEHLNSYSGAPMPASDVFAVGALLYAALTGQLPIPWLDDEVDYVNRLRAVSMTDIATLRPDLTNDQAAMVRRCMHPQPARRFVTARKLASALEKLP